MSSFGGDHVLNAARAAATSGAWGDVRAVLELDPAASATDATRAMLLGEACLRTGDPRTASTWLDTAAPLLERSGDRPSQRHVLNMQGAAAFALGTFDLAQDRFGDALSRARRDADDLLMARATNNLGAIWALRGDAERAITSYQLAIPAYQRLGNAKGLAESAHNLGIAYRMRGELNAADESERRAIEFALQAGDQRLAAMAQVGRAEIALRRGDPAWSRATLLRAIHVFSELPDYLLAADAHWLLADACDQANLQSESELALARSLELAQRHGHRLQEAQAYQTDAQIASRRGNGARAREMGLRAMDIFREIGSLSAVEDVADLLSQLAAE